jgi:outer membrane protein
MTFSLVRAYLAAVTAKKLADVAQQQVAQNERHLAATQARVEAQTQPPLAAKRAQLELLRAKSSLTSARASYDTAIATLGLVLGREEAFDVATDAQALPAPPAGTPDELAQKAIEARPDLVVQRKALEIAERQVTDGWMQFLPSVNLVARASASSFTSGFVKDPINGTLTLTALVPLYDGGNRYAALRDSHSKVREESIRLRQLEERVRAQVRGNARDIETKELSLALAKESAEIARVAVEQANAMFDAGVGTSLDVSDTQLRLFLAETELLRAEQDLAIARAGLAYVSGVPLYPAP